MAKTRLPPLPPSTIGLVYKHKTDLLGTAVNGIVFYPDGSTEFGTGKVFHLGDAVEFLRKVCNFAKRHKEHHSPLISLEAYSEANHIPLEVLKEFGSSALGYACGVRRVQLGFTTDLYFPIGLARDMILAQEWIDSDKDLEAAIIGYMTKLRRPATADVIARGIKHSTKEVAAQLGSMTLRDIVIYSQDKYQLSLKVLKQATRRS